MNPSQTRKPSQTTTASSTTVTVTGKRKLPENEAELEKCLKPYRMYAKLAVKFVDKLDKYFEVGELDTEEKEAGTQAFAALMYEESMAGGARALMVLWLATTQIPRGIDYVDKRMAKRRKPNLLDGTKAQLEVINNGTKASNT